MAALCLRRHKLLVSHVISPLSICASYSLWAPLESISGCLGPRSLSASASGGTIPWLVDVDVHSLDVTTRGVWRLSTDVPENCAMGVFFTIRAVQSTALSEPLRPTTPNQTSSTFVPAPASELRINVGAYKTDNDKTMVTNQCQVRVGKLRGSQNKLLIHHSVRQPQPLRTFPFLIATSQSIKISSSS